MNFTMSFQKNSIILHLCYCLVILHLLLSSVSCADLFEGSRCRLQDRTLAICTKLPECNSLYEGLTKRSVNYQDIVRCSFVGNVEVVCCPDRRPDPLQSSSTELPKDPIVFENKGNNLLSLNTSNKIPFQIPSTTTTEEPSGIPKELNNLEFIDFNALLHRGVLTTSTTTPDSSTVVNLFEKRPNLTSKNPRPRGENSLLSTSNFPTTLNTTLASRRQNQVIKGRNVTSSVSNSGHTNNTRSPGSSIRTTRKPPVIVSNSSGKSKQPPNLNMVHLNTTITNGKVPTKKPSANVSQSTTGRKNVNVNSNRPNQPSHQNRGVNSTTNCERGVNQNVYQNSKKLLIPCPNQNLHQNQTQNTTREPSRHIPNNVKGNQSTQSSFLDPWMLDALNVNRNTSKSSIHLVNNNSNTSRKEISNNRNNNLNNIINSNKNSTKNELPISRRTPTPATRSPSFNNNHNRNKNNNNILDPWMKDALVGSERLMSSTPPSFNQSTPRSHEALKNVLDPWMKDALNSNNNNNNVDNSKGFPSSHNSNGGSSNTDIIPPKTEKRETLQRPPVRDNSRIWGISRTGFNDNESDESRNDDDSTEITQSRGTGRKADVACAEYSKDVSPSLTYHILNGIPTYLGEFPHMAGLGFPFSIGSSQIEFKCGGTLISRNFVLTAAHCISKDGPVMVRLGKITIDSDLDGAEPVDRQINEIILHPSYAKSFQYHDIALLRLTENVQFTDTIRPACLNTDPNDMRPGTDVIVTGWGSISTATRQKSGILLKANLSTVDLRSCNQAHDGYAKNRKIPNGLNEGQLCAFDPELRKDACEGDSGGPLQLVDSKGVSTIYGVTSFGIGCATRIPGVYARVGHYLDWIESIVWP